MLFKLVTFLRIKICVFFILLMLDTRGRQKIEIIIKENDAVVIACYFVYSINKYAVLHVQFYAV